MAGRGPALAEHPLTAAAVTGAAPGLPSANTASTAPPDPCASTLRKPALGQDLDARATAGSQRDEYHARVW